MSDTINVADIVRYDPVRNCFVLKGPMKKQPCKCHPDSPFHWAHNTRPSIFLQDVMFRAKGVTLHVEDNLTKEQSMIAYKQFGIFSRAHPLTKPSLNKHEQ